MGLFSSSEKTRSTHSVDLANPSRDEINLLRNQLTLSQQQVENFSKLSGFNSQMFYRALPQLVSQANQFLPAENRITGRSLSTSGDIIGAQSGLFNDALAQIDRGVQLSPDQAALIKSSADNAISAGTSDIAAFRDDSIRSLVQEQSIARGLRPEDTPIGDVGGRIAKDADRQASELINTVRSQEAQQRLQYPIQAGQYEAGLRNTQQQLGTTNQAFINQLKQDAFNNRLNLISTGGSVGTNIAGIGPNASTLSDLQRLRLGSASTYDTGKTSGSPSIMSDIGQLVGATGAGIKGFGDFQAIH